MVLSGYMDAKKYFEKWTLSTLVNHDQPFLLQDEKLLAEFKECIGKKKKPKRNRKKPKKSQKEIGF